MSATDGKPRLSVRGLTKVYGSSTVLAGFDLDVRPGEVVALLGENGAGKSTASSIIAGVVRPDGGTMTWEGSEYRPGYPGDAIEAGIGLIHQELQLLPDLSIAENVFVGRLPVKGGRVDHERMNRVAGEQLHRLGLDLPPTELVGKLKVAAQQQVEIAKALCLDSRLLILDEPTAALGAAETERLFGLIRDLRAAGVSFIYISHRLDEIPVIADRIVVLRDGELVATHDRSDVPVNELISQMVGRDVDRIFPPLDEPRAEVALEVKGFSSASGVFADIGFKVHAGEVFGIAGIIGAGRTELVRAITGADPISSGTLKVNGKEVPHNEPHESIEAGIVLVPEDRKQQGLILDHVLSENIAIGNRDVIDRKGWSWPDKVVAFANKAIDSIGVRGRASQRVGVLSGGNQQKALIAKWVAREPKVFILDEPTRGIDVGARAAIYQLVARLTRAGMAVILVSSDLEEVIGLAHRVLVMNRGQSRGVLERAEASRETVINLATT